MYFDSINGFLGVLYSISCYLSSKSDLNNVQKKKNYRTDNMDKGAH